MSTAAIVRRCSSSKALILGERCDGRHRYVVTVLPSPANKHRLMHKEKGPDSGAL